VRVCFFHSDKPRERILASAFAEGVSRKDYIELRRLTGEVQVVDCDVAVMVGVKSRELFQAYWRAGVHTVYLDKGYTRHATTGGPRAWEYWRVAVDAHHPTHYLGRVNFPDDRLKRLGLTIQPWRESGRHIVVAGSSQKYHDFYGLCNPTEYAAKIVKRLRKQSGRKIIYRPKPSWKDAVPVEGAKFSIGGTIADVLQDAHALVTHGSNAVFEAVLCGVPCIVLGDAVAKPISSTQIEEIENPRLASDEERWQWLANLAYCQWTLPEFASGEAWSHIRPLIYA
jgi:hypothetical protein